MVSIIVPVYNTAKYLPKCIESILNQTYSDLELILVDDGSTDDSIKICQKYAVMDKRIIVLHKDNGGQGSARNKGLDQARGEYLAFVDSDDAIEPNLLEVLMKNLADADADISCGGVYCKEDKSDFVYEAEAFVKDNENAMKMFVVNQQGFNHSPVAKIFKRSVFKNVRFLELRGFEDAGTIFKAFMAANRVVSQPMSLYFYLQREDSTMHRKFSEKDFDRVLAYKEMEKGLYSDSRYRESAKIVTASKVGAIYYVLGELMRSQLEGKERLIKSCQAEAKATLYSGYQITMKNKLLLRLLLVSPKLYGKLYEKRH